MKKRIMIIGSGLLIVAVLCAFASTMMTGFASNNELNNVSKIEKREVTQINDELSDTITSLLKKHYPLMEDKDVALCVPDIISIWNVNKEKYIAGNPTRTEEQVLDLVVGLYESQLINEAKYKNEFNGIVVKDDSEVIQAVPKCSLKRVVFSSGKIWLGSDYSYNFIFNDFCGFFNESFRKEAGMPEDCVMREMATGQRYLIFDMDEGCRLFVFMDLDAQKGGTAIVTGFPIIYKNRLSYSDFSGLSIGDSIVEVEKIDDICEFYEERFKIPIGYGIMENLSKQGRGCNSIHYLTDGLLKIEYGSVNEKQEATITSIDFYPDYTMETFSGKKLNYSINPLDLP